jgi:hypothetical protein
MKSLAIGLVFLAACGGAPMDAADGDPNDGTQDSAFNPNHIMDDNFYLDSGYASADEIQKFLENTPWHNRSWLADYQVDGTQFSSAIVSMGKQKGLNPLMILSRIQTESSLVSKTAQPDGRAGEFALGCHKVTAEHPNGLDPSVASMSAQLDCGTNTLQTLIQKVKDGTSVVKVGEPFRTMDPETVTPDDEATAALYSYTPWVLQGKGGNWLVWSTSQKFDNHLKTVVRN